LIKEGDCVFNPITGNIGEVDTIYDEIGVAIVFIDDEYGKEKAFVKDLLPMRVHVDKKKTLLDKIKAKFF
jgi:hypothetical protein